MRTHKGILLTCDVAVKEYLVWLDQSGALGAPFVLREVDDEHLFVVADRPNLFQTLQEYLDAWHDVSHSSKHNTRRAQERNAVRANSFSAAQQQAVTAAQQQASQAHLPPAAQRQRQAE